MATAQDREATKNVIRAMSIVYPERFEGIDLEATMDQCDDFGLRLIIISFTNEYQGPDGRNRIIGLSRLARAIAERERLYA